MPRPERRSILLGGLVLGLAPWTLPWAREAPRVRRGDEFGLAGDARTDNRRALEQALIDHEDDLWVGPGIYRFSGPIELRASPRELVFAPGAVLLGDDPSQSGLCIRDGHALRLAGLNLRWRRTANRRIGFGAGLLVQRCTDIQAHNVRIDGGGGAGILFDECVRPSLHGAYVQDTLADGVHFSNCEAAQVQDVDTLRTGDDGLAFVNYAPKMAAQGAHAVRVRVNDSNARGIAVVGQSSVRIEQFSIRRTRGSGLYIAQEDSYRTRTPSDVAVSNGTIELAGDMPGAANRSGIEVSRADNVTLADITVSQARGRLLDASHVKGRLRLQRLRLLDNTRSEGVHLTRVDDSSLEQIDIHQPAGIALVAKQGGLMAWQDLRIQTSDQCRGCPAVVLDGVEALQGGSAHVQTRSGDAAQIILKNVQGGNMAPMATQDQPAAHVSRSASPNLTLRTLGAVE